MHRHYTGPKIYPFNPTSNDMSKDWFVWFRIHDPNTGRWIQKSYKKGINNFKKYRDRLAEATSLCQDLTDKLEQGWNPLVRSDKVVEIKITSLKEAIDFILKIKSQTLRLKTKQTYRHITGIFKLWLEETKRSSIKVERFDSTLAQQYMDQLLLKRNYCGRTFNDHLIILSTFFNAMVKREWCKENPFRSVPRMKTTVGRNIAFTDDEKAMLRKVLYNQDRWMYYFSQIMYFCFIRRTEMARLRIGDVDLENKSIIIRGDIAKNDHQESVIIPVGLEPILQEMQLHNYPGEFFVFGRHMFPSEFPYSNVNHISTRHNKFCRKLKLDPSKGLYGWKHTGVCAAYYATGKDIYAVMRQLRHRDLNTTQIYLKSLGLLNNEVFRNSMIA